MYPSCFYGWGAQIEEDSQVRTRQRVETVVRGMAFCHVTMGSGSGMQALLGLVRFIWNAHLEKFIAGILAKFV